MPSSEFVTADDLVSQSSLAAIWQRIQGASTGGTPTGLHGSGIAYVKALPSGQLLSTTTETTIKVTDELAVRGRRRGHRREPGGPDQGHADDPEAARPDRQDRRRSRSSTPGETKSVVFTVGALVPFGEQTTVKVDVDPVPGETNTTNNTAEYPVIFTL